MKQYLNLFVEFPKGSQQRAAFIKAHFADMSYGINERITDRGYAEAWSLVYCPNYHADQLKRKRKGQSSRTVRFDS